MSHFTKLAKTSITSIDAFVAAMSELGLTKVERNQKITDYAGKTIDVDVVIRTGGRYDIGLQKNDKGTYDAVADWWGIRGERTKGFTDCGTDKQVADKILRLTTKNAITAKYKRMGFRVNEVVGDDRKIRLELTKA
jgi:hypothetical protein